MDVETEKSWRLKRRHWCRLIGLNFLFRKTPIITSKERTVQPGNAFEDTALSRGLKLSNSKPGCRVSALHLFVKKMPPTAFWHWAHSDMCFFQLLIPGLTSVSQQENESGFEIVTQLVDTDTQLVDTEKTKIFTCIVYDTAARVRIILISFFFSVVIGSHSNAIKLRNVYQKKEEKKNIRKKKT